MGSNGDSGTENSFIFPAPLSHLYHPLIGAWPYSREPEMSLSPLLPRFPQLCPRPFHTPAVLTPDPGLRSQRRRRKHPGLSPGPRRAQRLDCRGCGGRIPGKPRVKQRGRHWAGRARRRRFAPEVVLLRACPVARKTHARAAAFSQSGFASESAALPGGLERRQSSLSSPLRVRAPPRSWRTFRGLRGSEWPPRWRRRDLGRLGAAPGVVKEAREPPGRC